MGKCNNLSRQCDDNRKYGFAIVKTMNTRNQCFYANEKLKMIEERERAPSERTKERERERTEN